MVADILSSSLLREMILPFILVFVVAFAVLQKTKILGDGKKQIDAIVALVIGLLLVGFGNATGMIVNLIPFLSVSLIVMLVFMLLWGFAFHTGNFEIPKKLRTAFGWIIGAAVIVAVLVVTPAWNLIKDLFGEGTMSTLVTNVILIVIVVAVIAVVVMGGKEKEEEEDKD